MLEALGAMRIKLKILALLAVMCLPVLGFAQDEDRIAFESYVGQMNAQCPYGYGDGWMIKSVIANGDTVAVELETPASLGGFISALTEDTVNAKRLWVDHLSNYGDKWKYFVEFLAKECCTLSLAISPKDSDNTCMLVVTCEDFGTILAND